MKTLLKIMFVLLLGAAAVGAYMAWRGGCRDWGSQGSWSQWSSCEDDQGSETPA